MPTDFLRENIKKVEERLELLLPESGGKFSSAIEAMRYSLLSGGKRIRPAILLEFYKLCGKNDENALNFAAAIEMIHTYSLIHDDLPCMDNDDMRRGRPSCHKAYGEDTALLAGDGLLTYAFYAAAETKGIKSENVLRAVSVLADKSGVYGMVGGQVMDLSFEKEKPDIDELKEMYLKKTSALLQISAMCGCILAGAEESKIKYAEEYGASLGLAFQIIDDILDCTADEKLFGKPVGSDLKNGKVTYVSVYGIEKAKETAAELTANAHNILDKFGGDIENLKALTEYLLNRKY